MINVDGDYDEIVKWLDQNPRRGVGFASLHGGTDGVCMNVGLFSVNQDHPDDESNCLSCQHNSYPSGGMMLSFQTLHVGFDTDGDYVTLEVEDPYNSHLIVF